MVLSGEVVKVNGEFVSVVFDRPATCANCNGCLNKQCTHIDLEADAAVGDVLDVQMPDKNILEASSIAYVTPLAMFIVGLFIGAALHAPLGISLEKDLFVALSAILCLALGLAMVTLVDRKLKGKQVWQPQVVAVHQKGKVTDHDTDTP